MKLTPLKHFVMATGLFRPALGCYRRTLRRDKLQRLRQEAAFFRRLLPAGSLCYDVGANVGEKTEALLAAGMRVAAFEPQQECMRELRARCSHYSGVSFHTTAVGRHCGHAELYVRSSSAVSGLVEEWEGHVVETRRVRLTTLDTAISELGLPYYCKLDVEGYEHEVLRGLSHPIPLLSFEYHLREQEWKQVSENLDYLAGLGPIEVNITPSEQLRFFAPQWYPLDVFSRVFPDQFFDRPGFDYGDIFVRQQTAHATTRGS